MYTTLPEVKTFLGITTNAFDDRLQGHIDYTCGLLETLIGDVNIQTRTELVTVCCFKLDGNGVEFEAGFINVTELTSINAVLYVGTLGIDYRVKEYQKKIVWIKNYQTYLTGIIDKYFDIVYEAGYGPTSNEIKAIKQAQNLMVQYYFNITPGLGIQKEKSGPEETVYNDKIGELILLSARNLLKNYERFTLGRTCL